ncbi:MAG: hypothetical protein HY735_27380 [Verrucomicrobia bacterium]|nr:hypothetical protein [Verrucomicrobiota bacterium]
MDNTSNQKPQDGAGNDVHKEIAGAKENIGAQARKCVLESVCDAIDKGAEDARRAAEKALPKLKRALSGAVYWVGYGVGFAAVFQWTLAKNLAPERMKSGCRDGVVAGREAAEKCVDKLRQRDQTASDSSPAEAPLSSTETQPGVA